MSKKKPPEVSASEVVVGGVRLDIVVARHRDNTVTIAVRYADGRTHSEGMVGMIMYEAGS